MDRRAQSENDIGILRIKWSMNKQYARSNANNARNKRKTVISFQSFWTIFSIPILIYSAWRFVRWKLSTNQYHSSHHLSHSLQLKSTHIFAIIQNAETWTIFGTVIDSIVALESALDGRRRSDRRC